MGILSIFLIAVSLSMDAFAVSVSNGLSVKGIRKIDMLLEGIFFGGFQFLMPLIGFFLGSSVKSYIESFDHWIAFGLLLIIGVNMIKESRESDDEKNETSTLTITKLTFQAVATSIDALAVGVSFAVLSVNIIEAGAIIGVVCFVISIIGSFLGKKASAALESHAELAGGIVLILIGVKILIEHLFL